MSWYQTLLRDPRWQRRRLEILQRDQWTCQQCGATTRELHVHHRWYVHGAAPWESADAALVTLCIRCHTGKQGEATMPPRSRTLMTAEGPLLPPPRLITVRFLNTHAGTIHIALGDNNCWYWNQEELKSAVARQEGKESEVLWSMYRRTTGDDFCRTLQALMEQERGPGINQHIQFSDSTGIKWIIVPFGIHFVAQYHGILEAQVYQFFSNATMVDATTRSPALPDNRASAVQKHLVAALSLLDEKVDALDEKVDAVDENLSTFKEQVGGQMEEVAQTATQALDQVTRVRHSQRQTLHDYAYEHGYLDRFGYKWMPDCATHLVGVHTLKGADVIKIGVTGKPYEEVNGYFVDIMDEAVFTWLSQRFTQGRL
jgi:hypothetical protein